MSRGPGKIGDVSRAYAEGRADARAGRRRKFAKERGGRYSHTHTIYNQGFWDERERMKLEQLPLALPLPQLPIPLTAERRALSR